ncbi:MAG TPA: hypothetical protein ENG30_03565, partial [Thermofilaceae archaeon]|nr:hypothetical protein [Thermofilaceae archaeon]
MITATSFRLATLTLELIERRKLSLERAFIEAVRRVGHSEKGALRIARLALMKFAEADYLLELSGLSGTPLRRKCAFRVAYSLVAFGEASRDEIGIVKGGLLSNRLFSLLSAGNLRRVLEEERKLKPTERLSVAYSFPLWLVERLVARIGFSDAERLVKACSRRVLWLRINTLKVSRSEVLRKLRREFNVREDKDFPELVELVGLEELPPSILKMIRRGHIVV